jgi:hypothetical protein
MPAHRLPLYRAAPDGNVYPEVPRVAPGCAIAVVDASGDGLASLTFSASLSRELMERGRSLGLALTSFADAPQISPARRAQFGPGQTVCALSAQASDEALRALLARERCWLLAGPAALAFSVPLVIMVGADVPLLRWPHALRAQRERISLALSGDGLAVAKALGRLLATS